MTIDYLCNNFSLFRYIFSFLSLLIPSSSTFKRNKNFSNISFEEKIQNLKKLISNDISSWKAFSDKYQFKTIYILQPGIKWVDKKLTKKEIFIYENQRVHLGETYYDKFMNKEIYLNHKNFLEQQCLKNNIDFIDSNKIFKSFPENEDLFSDLCHLTDQGNKYLADYLSKNMDKKSKSALIIGFGRMGQLYCQILKEFGFLNIEIVDKKTKNLTIANREYGISKNFISRKIKKAFFNKISNRHFINYD